MELAEKKPGHYLKVNSIAMFIVLAIHVCLYYNTG